MVELVERTGVDEPVVQIVLAGGGEPSRLTLRGSVDVRSASELRRAAMELAECGHDVVVSCEGVVRIDVSALQVLIALDRELRRRTQRLDLIDVPPSIASLLSLGGLEDRA